MRILWLSPWLRPPARVAAENLQRLGAEVMLVTSDLHPESDQPRPPEAERRFVGAIRADATDAEIDAFVAALNEGLPEPTDGTIDQLVAERRIEVVEED